jgi:hypothetical protein
MRLARCFRRGRLYIGPSDLSQPHNTDKYSPQKTRVARVLNNLFGRFYAARGPEGPALLDFPPGRRSPLDPRK